MTLMTYDQSFSFFYFLFNDSHDQIFGFSGILDIGWVDLEMIKDKLIDAKKLFVDLGAKQSR